MEFIGKDSGVTVNLFFNDVGNAQLDRNVTALTVFTHVENVLILDVAHAMILLRSAALIVADARVSADALTAEIWYLIASAALAANWFHAFAAL